MKSNNHTMIKNLFAVVVLLFYFAQNTYVFAAFEPIDAYVVNGLPDYDPLVVHIFSGDDDLQYHILAVNESFHWNFRMAAFDNTKFYGHFWWPNKNKDRKFAVFDHKICINHCGEDDFKNTCWWLAKEDGFYLANKANPTPQDLIYMNWWMPQS